MKIFYLCPDLGIPPSGSKGAAAHLRGFLRALCSLGHDVRLITPHAERRLFIGGDTQIPVVRVPRPAIIDGIKEGCQPRLQRALGHLWMNVAVEGAVSDLIRTQRPDLVYERYSPFSVAGVMSCRRLGVPHILEVNAPLAWEGTRYRAQALGEAAESLERAAFAAASNIVVVSQELKRMLISAGVSSSKIAVVPNGVDVDLFRSEGEAQRQGLEGKVVLGFVGSLKPWHGIDLLAEAYRRLAASDPRLHLLVVGEGPGARAVEALAAELPGRVTQVGAVPQRQVASYLRAMDIAVAPYPRLDRFYYSPLKVLEYMATGRAVVASEIGQVRELIRHRETGVLVQPGATAELADAIAALVADGALRRRLGAAAAADVRRQHLWTHRVDRILQLRRAAA